MELWMDLLFGNWMGLLGARVAYGMVQELGRIPPLLTILVIFLWGWNADYPDPENFLFLLYGPNKKVGNNGENASNYENPKFDALFEKMANMENSPERLKIIKEML